MLRTITTIDKSVTTLPTPVVTVTDSTPTDVLPKVTSVIEYAARSIQNLGANLLSYSWGADCDGVNMLNGQLAQGQQVDCFTGERVSCYCIGGTTVAVTVCIRGDMTQHATVFPA